MTKNEAGKRGGTATLKRHGADKLRAWGKLGGRPRRNPERDIKSPRKIRM